MDRNSLLGKVSNLHFERRLRMNLVTWNMEGGNDSYTNKWRNDVLRLFSQDDIKADVCCLQECGRPPGSARPGSPFPNLPPGVEYYTWGGSTSRETDKHIFIYEWGVNPRCSLAVVSNELPTRVQLFEIQNNPLRPALGIELYGRCYFTIHAKSGGGADAIDLIQLVNNSCNNPWIVAGDFNREPNTLNIVPLIICPPKTPTYNAKHVHPKSKYDYLVKSNGNQIIGLAETINASDHFPVLFRDL